MDFLMKTVQFPLSVDDRAIANLRQEISAAIRAGSSIILIDFQAVESMSSAGLIALVHVLQQVREAERKLFITAINEQVRMLLELTGMDQVFEVFVRPDERVSDVDRLISVP
jgi:anti-sigma B factor antagonist